MSDEFPESKVMKHQQQKLTFVNLMRHFTTRSEKRWFLAAKLSLDAGEGHLEGSNGRKRLIRTTKDDVRSALSCTNNHQLLRQETRRNYALLCKKRNHFRVNSTRILSINTFKAFKSWLPSSIWGTLSSKSQSRSSVIRLSRVLSWTA